MSEWDFMSPASRKNLKDTIRREYDAMVALVSAEGAWESRTAAGDWQCRDIIGHLTAVTEGYFVSYDAARGNGEVTMRDVMAFSLDMDSDARTLSRTLSQDELLARLDANFTKMESIFDSVTDEEWASLTVTHGHFGPMPQPMFAIFQLVDYAVHGWDIREGTGQRHAMYGPSADLLSLLAVRLAGAMVYTPDDFKIGITITSGPNAGSHTIRTGGDGPASSTPGLDDDVLATIEVDPATLILMWYGRFNTGTIRGDQDAAHRFLKNIAVI
jgi:uncharacterized protein (TIGR03083 family)